MNPHYDQAILAHYREQADLHGKSASCTMENDVIRAKETEVILTSVTEFIRSQATEYGENGGYATGPGRDGNYHIVDIGCGNGTTISELIDNVPGTSGCSVRFTGVEYSPEMRELARKRFANQPNAEILAGDVREIPNGHISPADIIVLQRVLINLLDPRDQRKALENVVDLLAPGGLLIAIEAFSSGIENLNKARLEFGLEPLPPAHHNLYLSDGFFEHDQLLPWSNTSISVSPNIFSTHYFVSRVLHDIALQAVDAPFKRNSHFVKFFSMALPEGIGNYAPQKVVLLRKRAPYTKER